MFMQVQENLELNRNKIILKNLIEAIPEDEWEVMLHSMLCGSTFYSCPCGLQVEVFKYSLKRTINLWNKLLSFCRFVCPDVHRFSNITMAPMEDKKCCKMFCKCFMFNFFEKWEFNTYFFIKHALSFLIAAEMFITKWQQDHCSMCVYTAGYIIYLRTTQLVFFPLHILYLHLIYNFTSFLLTPWTSSLEDLCFWKPKARATAQLQMAGWGKVEWIFCHHYLGPKGVS